MINEDNFIVMETNIDDCSPEILGYTMDLLLEAGALDVFYTPVFMKKNRPACLLTVTCQEADLHKLAAIIFRETTTIGIRYRRESRIILKREAVKINTDYGELLAKKVYAGEETYIYPEYESFAKIAKEKGIALKDLYKLSLKEQK